MGRNQYLNIKLKTALLQDRRKQWQVAQAAEMTETRLSRLVRARNEATEDEKLRLSKLLGVPVSELFEDHDDRQVVPNAPTHRSDSPPTRKANWELQNTQRFVNHYGEVWLSQVYHDVFLLTGGDIDWRLIEIRNPPYQDLRALVESTGLVLSEEEVLWLSSLCVLGRAMQTMHRYSPSNAQEDETT